MDIELSTKSDAHDVINVTFIYLRPLGRRRLGVPLTDLSTIRRRPRPDWDANDFLPGSTAAFKDRQGRLCAIPWIADVQMAGASRYDLIQQAGMKLPDTFDELAAMLKAVNGKDDIPAWVVENHYGWTFIPFPARLWRQRFPQCADRPDADARHAGSGGGGGFLLQQSAAITVRTACCPTPMTRCWRR